MTDTIESFPAPNSGIANIAVGIVLSGTGVTEGVGEFEYNLSAPYQSTTMVTASVVDAAGNPVSPQPSLTVTSTNGPPTQIGAASKFTGYPVGGGGQVYVNVPNQYRGTADVAGIGANSNVASVTGTATATVTINNTGTALIEWSANGITGRLLVTGTNVVTGFVN
jgi:hypothetical protein